MGWDGIGWGEPRRDGTGWDAMRWDLDGMGWDGIQKLGYRGSEESRVATRKPQRKRSGSTILLLPADSNAAFFPFTCSREERPTEGPNSQKGEDATKNGYEHFLISSVCSSYYRVCDDFRGRFVFLRFVCRSVRTVYGQLACDLGRRPSWLDRYGCLEVHAEQRPEWCSMFYVKTTNNNNNTRNIVCIVPAPFLLPGRSERASVAPSVRMAQGSLGGAGEHRMELHEVPCRGGQPRHKILPRGACVRVCFGLLVSAKFRTENVKTMGACGCLFTSTSSTG